MLLILITLEIPTLQLSWFGLRKVCYVNICNINVKKIVRVSLSEKSKDSNLKESIDFNDNSSEVYLDLSRTSMVELFYGMS